VVTNIVSFVVVICALILIHEWGHFVVARLSGVGVERFSIGFGPVLWRFKGKETEYCLSAIPMGGYVKMVGDDENPLEGGRTDSVDPKRAFNLKPVWVRFLIVFAGPGMNFVLAFLILASLPMLFGRGVLPAVVTDVVERGPAALAGLRPGDRITAVDGQPVEYWSQIAKRAQEGRGAPMTLTVKRDADTLQVEVTPKRATRYDALGDTEETWDLGVGDARAVPPRVGEVVPGMPAEKAGLKPGDLVVGVMDQPVTSWQEMAAIINKRAGQPTALTIRRGEEKLAITVTPDTVDGAGRIGIGPVPSLPENLVYVRTWNPVSAVMDGWTQTIQLTSLTVKAFWRLVTGRISPASLGGPIQIAVAAGQSAKVGMSQLLFFTALVSVNLAVLNLLPVPMLDGGHLLFFACEAVLGRPISVRKREIAQQVGFVLLMMLMVFALYNDVSRLGWLHFLR
jgi:regulator of sigma E protease